ncbi:hypothetical protein HY990_00345 [Candidatus Micrarchaeota archaeon]|nr:hypothetical protein [Candidatus Micrarchaeota archaeon]
MENTQNDGKEKNHKEETVKVKCSFCSAEMESPKGMAQMEKHSCYDCYVKMTKETHPDQLEKMHVVLPLDKPEVFSNYVGSMVLSAFDELWSGEKQKLKERSKQELARDMFVEGSRFMMDLSVQITQWRAEHGNNLHGVIGGK